MSKSITVTMRHGKATIETDGFEGTSCLEATKKLEDLLSGDGGVEVRDMHGNLVEESVKVGY